MSKFILILGAVLSFSLSHAVENGDYRCVAETAGLSIPDYVDAPASVHLDFTMANLLEGGFRMTHNDFDFPEILKEEVVKGRKWIPGQFAFNEGHKTKNNTNTYVIEESQAYQSYHGKHSFKWSKSLDLYKASGSVKLDIEYATFWGEDLVERNGFKLKYICN